MMILQVASLQVEGFAAYQLPAYRLKDLEDACSNMKQVASLQVEGFRGYAGDER